MPDDLFLFSAAGTTTATAAAPSSLDAAAAAAALLRTTSSSSSSSSSMSSGGGGDTGITAGVIRIKAQAPANDQVIHPSLSLSTSSSALEPLSIEDAVDRDLAEPLAGKEAFESYPDGGREAWTMVAACFTLFLTTLGGIYSWGVLQDRLVAEGLAPASTLVWIGSVQASIESVIALPGARLVAAYGPRRVALVGSILAAVGPILASFCTHSVAGLIVTEGFMFGLGQALCFYASATLPATYFLRRRNLATGIVFSGAGVGGAVFSIITAQLLEATDLAWTLRIVGCIFLALNLPAALLLKSRSQREPFFANKKLVQWSAFQDKRFTLLLVGSSIALFPLFVPPFFLPLYANSVGLSTSMSSLVLAGFNLSSAVGRFGFGVFADLLLGSLNSLVVCLFLVGISTLVIWPLATSVAPLVVFAIVNGLCAGGMFSLFPGTVANVFGSRNLSQFFSLIFFFWMPGYFLGSPIAGYLLQAYGGPEGGIGAYRPAIFYSGVLSLIAAGFVLAVRIIQDRSVFKKM